MHIKSCVLENCSVVEVFRDPDQRGAAGGFLLLFPPSPSPSPPPWFSPLQTVSSPAAHH